MNIKLKENESLNITSGGSEISLNDFVKWNANALTDNIHAITANGLQISGTTGHASGAYDGRISFLDGGLYIDYHSGVAFDGLTIGDASGEDTQYRFPLNRKGEVALTKDHYTKAEIDSKIGDIETLLASI